MGMKIGGSVLGMGVLVGTAIVAVPAPAAAAVGSVSASGSIVTVTGTDAAERITVYSYDGARTIEVNTYPDFTAGPGCTLNPTTTYITCELPSAGRVNVMAAGGDDEITADNDAAFDTEIFTSAGPGNDEMWGGPAIEAWIGDDGNDVIHTDLSSNEDQVGRDLVRGGAGVDTVHFATYLTGVVVTLDDKPNDTSSANPAYDTNDIGADVEVVWGTGGDDVLIGNDLPQQLEGSAGNDTISGLGGDDVLGGGRGNDRLDGGLGNDQVKGSDNDDVIDGGPGDDTLFGGAENDTITGGPGLDTINGDAGDLLLSGNDVIKAVDGERDVVACGPGGDTAEVDDLDVVSHQAQDVCESVSVTKTVPPPAPPAPPGTAAVATLSGKVLKLNRKGTATRLSIACGDGGATCSGKVSLSLRKATVGKGRYALEPGENGRVTVRLTRKGKALLKRRAKLRVLATLTPADGAKVTRKLVLKRR